MHRNRDVENDSKLSLTLWLIAEGWCLCCMVQTILRVHWIGRSTMSLPQRKIKPCHQGDHNVLRRRSSLAESILAVRFLLSPSYGGSRPLKQWDQAAIDEMHEVAA